MNLKITVFTPTYNRAHLLKRLYESLKRQKYIDFEWIIVDDGSIDNTRFVVNEFIKEKIINIKYIYQENAGKHIAINNGLLNSNGDCFFIVDSDDYILDDTLQVISNKFSSIRDDNAFVGIAGLKIYENGTIIGKTFSKDYIDCTNLERKKYKIIGDKAEVFKTKILKNYLFPKIDDEKFMPEAYIWNKMASDNYKIRWYNEKFIICEYLSDGLTKNSEKLIKNNYKGQLIYLKDLIKYERYFFAKIAHMSSFCVIASEHYNYDYIANQLGVKKITVEFLIMINKIRKQVKR